MRHRIRSTRLIRRETRQQRQTPQRQSDAVTRISRFRLSERGSKLLVVTNDVAQFHAHTAHRAVSAARRFREKRFHVVSGHGGMDTKPPCPFSETRFHPKGKKKRPDRSFGRASIPAAAALSSGGVFTHYLHPPALLRIGVRGGGAGGPFRAFCIGGKSARASCAWPGCDALLAFSSRAQRRFRRVRPH